MERKKLFSTLWHHSYPSSGFQVPRTAFYIYTFYHVSRINFLVYVQLYLCGHTAIHVKLCQARDSIIFRNISWIRTMSSSLVFWLVCNLYLAATTSIIENLTFIYYYLFLLPSVKICSLSRIKHLMVGFWTWSDAEKTNVLNAFSDLFKFWN